MKKVLIIGAGPAGITAGFELLKNRINTTETYDVTILEETCSIGGISRTAVHGGNRMDIGGHRFFSKDRRVSDWWQELMPMQGAPALDDKLLQRDVPLSHGGPDPEKSDRVMLSRRRVSRIYYGNKFFDYPVTLSADTVKNMGLASAFTVGCSYLKSSVFKRRESSLEDFYINRFGRKLYSMFFEGYTEKLWGRHPRDISADWGAQRVKGLSVAAVIRDVFQKTLHIGKAEKTETSLIRDFKYPKLGPGQLWETAASEFEKMGGRIKFGCKATAIKTDGAKVTAVTYTSNGREITESADIVISSMPIKDLVLGMDSAPKDIRRIAGGLPYRDFVTVGLLVKKLAVKNGTQLKTLGNIVPDCWIYVQDTSVKLGRIQIFNNWSPYLAARPEDTVWLGLEYFCREGDEYWNMSEKQWTGLAVSELLKMGILESPEDVLDSHKESVKKAYPAYFDTYSELSSVVSYLSGFENLYCVGRNGQHRYNNMDHSMVTAFEAVKNIQYGISDKSNVWSVNTEDEYHEEK